MKQLSVVILAAGQGTRMRSALPKVLHRLAGKPLLKHVIDAAGDVDAGATHIIFGHGGDQVRATIEDAGLNWVEQREQLGTGHAVQQVIPNLDLDHRVLILYGDVPLIEPSTLSRLLERLPEQGLALLTVDLVDPSGYGRIVRTGDGRVTAIVEHKDASDAQREITEVNTGILAAHGQDLARWLKALNNDNAQGEYYLTDIIAMAANEGGVQTAQPQSTFEVEGVNDRRQLATLERVYQRNQANRLMAAGITLADPDRIDVRGSLTCGSDTCIDINLVTEGAVIIGENCIIEPNVVLKDVKIGNNCIIKANSHLEQAMLADHCQVGPFARVRPGTELADGAFIGNFVETKNAKIGAMSKASHLSYVGDAIIGKRVNIGAGTITCNYDGANKHQTVMEDDVFIGSDSQLVAPVTIGEGATVGAGTTVTDDVAAQNLCVSRVKQRQIEGWERPKKKPK